MSEESRVRTFRKLALVCLVVVYLLIMIGSSVRASGAGMGCPDWPTCFGRLIPPVEESQLPTNYREIYADLGYANQPFNPVKTWTEFGNRLAGVSTGLLIVMLFGYSLLLVRIKPKLVVVSTAVLMITGFQGWLGSVVVSSNLHPLIVSAHMLFALVMVACLHALVEMTHPARRLQSTARVWPILLVCATLLLIQIAAGLHVREQIDAAVILFGYDNKDQWTDYLNQVFGGHMLIAVTLLMLVLYIRQRLVSELAGLLSPLPNLWLAAVFGSVASGFVMWQFAVPVFAQPLHLLFASVQFGVLFHILLRLMRSSSPDARKDLIES